MKITFLISLLCVLISCGDSSPEKNSQSNEKQREALPNATETGVSLVVLGTVQDAGSPHIGCKKECCAILFEHPDPTRKVVALGILDHENEKTFLFDATPDITTQLKLLKNHASWPANELPDGIFLTHAHIGHYTGLMYLGKEATNSNAVPTYVMPRMKNFLTENGPWSQLVSQKNIDLQPIKKDKALSMTSNLQIIPLQVPHRDEFSETVGYKIIGPNKTALFIPDIDKWEKWDKDILDMIKSVDYAFLDASFYDGDELNRRDISEIPHPFVVESMALFELLPKEEKRKVHFIHLNHTNTLLDANSEQAMKVSENGFNIAQFNQRFGL